MAVIPAKAGIQRKILQPTDLPPLLRRSLTDLKFPSWYSPPVARRRNALLPCPIMMYSLKNQPQYSLWNTKHPMIGRQFQMTRNQIDTNRDFHAIRAYPPHLQRDFAKNSVYEIEQPLPFFFFAHTLLFNFRLVFLAPEECQRRDLNSHGGFPHKISSLVNSPVIARTLTSGSSPGQVPALSWWSLSLRCLERVERSKGGRGNEKARHPLPVLEPIERLGRWGRRSRCQRGSFRCFDELNTSQAQRTWGREGP